MKRIKAMVAAVSTSAGPKAPSGSVEDMLALLRAERKEIDRRKSGDA